MKKLSKNIFHLFALTIAAALLVFSSCEQEAMKEFDSVPTAGTPSLSLSVDSYTDSAMTVAYDLGTAGRVTMALYSMPADTPTVESMEIRDLGGAMGIRYMKHDGENATGTATFMDLEPGMDYIVFGIGHNTDGNVSNLVSVNPVTTEDTHPPMVEGFTPSPSLNGYFDPYADGYPADAPVQIHFQEPVVYNSDYGITIDALSGFSYPVPADSIVVNGSTVTIKHETLPYNGDIIFVSVDSGAVEDRYGNAWDGIDSYLSGNTVYGWYYGTAPNPNNVLGNIFSNFSGEYETAFYAQSDSTTEIFVDTVSLSQSTDDGFMVTHPNFRGWGEDYAVEYEFQEESSYKYLTCKEQTLDSDLFVEAFSDAFEDNGSWRTSDYGFNISVNIRYISDGTLFDSYYIEYTKVTDGTKSLDLTGVPYKIQ